MHHLLALQEEGYHTGVLFLVHWARAKWFLPDYHTDIEFAKTFKEAAPKLDWKAVSLKWDESFTMPKVVRNCSYDGNLLAKEAEDKGDYIMVLHLGEDRSVSVGSKGRMEFKAGYYMYVGSAKANLTQRMERHKRKRKNKHWHLDYLRGYCDVVAAMAVRSSDDLECAMAQDLRKITEWEIPKFGSSDCHCKSHLFGMTENPIHNEAFMMFVEEYRMNRLDLKINKDV